jgi:hypothetical protein
LIVVANGGVWRVDVGMMMVILVGGGGRDGGAIMDI